jgi:hypothetical protein
VYRLVSIWEAQKYSSTAVSLTYMFEYLNILKMATTGLLPDVCATLLFRARFACAPRVARSCFADTVNLSVCVDNIYNSVSAPS